MKSIWLAKRFYGSKTPSRCDGTAVIRTKLRGDFRGKNLLVGLTSQIFEPGLEDPFAFLIHIDVASIRGLYPGGPRQVLHEDCKPTLALAKSFLYSTKLALVLRGLRVRFGFR